MKATFVSFVRGLQAVVVLTAMGFASLIVFSDKFLGFTHVSPMIHFTLLFVAVMGGMFVNTLFELPKKILPFATIASVFFLFMPIFGIVAFGHSFLKVTPLLSQIGVAVMIIGGVMFAFSKNKEISV